ncbi:NUDIX domain-containing protein [Ditylenchus destructor]|nr:NUDIX domain-containing protein [Ditylenchus destructor]
MPVHIRRISSIRSIAEKLNPIQAHYLDEPCIHVTEKDEPIGSVSKKDCHRNPILHRAFSVFIFDSERRLLLQKRSLDKITFPGVWTNACCSHPLHNRSEMDMPSRSGENSDFAIGIRRAAKRKLDHELGISNIDVAQFHVMGRFIYKAASDNDWMEHELDYALVVPNFDCKNIRPNSEEVSDIKLVDQSTLECMMQDSKTHKFSPWFNLFANFDWLKLWWNNLHDLEKLKDLKTIHRLN